MGARATPEIERTPGLIEYFDRRDHFGWSNTGIPIGFGEAVHGVVKPLCELAHFVFLA